MSSVIANAVKQSVRLMKKSMTFFSCKLTDCFVALAMTKLKIYLPTFLAIFKTALIGFGGTPTIVFLTFPEASIKYKVG
jgi:hypothetical protein